MKASLEELEKAKFDYASRLVSFKDGRRKLNTRLSVAESEKVQAEQKLAEVKSHLKNSDHQYLQLSEVVECARRKLALSKKKVTELNVALGNSQHELARALPQLVVAPDIWFRAWGLGFKLGIKQLCELLFCKLETNLETLAWKSLSASATTFHVFDTFGRDVMADAFPSLPNLKIMYVPPFL